MCIDVVCTFQIVLTRDIDLRLTGLRVVFEAERNFFALRRARIVIDRAVVSDPEPSKETGEAGDDAATGRLFCRRLRFVERAIEIAVAGIERAAAGDER